MRYYPGQTTQEERTHIQAWISAQNVSLGAAKQSAEANPQTDCEAAKDLKARDPFSALHVSDHLRRNSRLLGKGVLGHRPVNPLLNKEFNHSTADQIPLRTLCHSLSLLEFLLDDVVPNCEIPPCSYVALFPLTRYTSA